MGELRYVGSGWTEKERERELSTRQRLDEGKRSVYSTYTARGSCFSRENEAKNALHRGFGRPVGLRGLNVFDLCAFALGLSARTESPLSDLRLYHENDTWMQSTYPADMLMYGCAVRPGGAWLDNCGFLLRAPPLPPPCAELHSTGAEAKTLWRLGVRWCEGPNGADGGTRSEGTIWVARHPDRCPAVHVVLAEVRIC